MKSAKRGKTKLPMQAMLQVRQTHLASAPIGAWEVKLEFFTDQQTDQQTNTGIEGGGASRL